MRNQLKRSHQKLSESSIVKFQEEIDSIRADTDTYTEAIAAYCEQHQADIEDILCLISSSMVDKIEKESIERRLIKSEYIEDDIESLELS